VSTLAQSVFGSEAGRRELAAALLPETQPAAEQSEVADQAADPYVGRLFWHTLPALRVSPEALAAAYDQAGIDRHYLPGPIRAADAFRRATSGLERTAEARMDGQDVHVTLLVRDAANDKERTVRQAVAEVRNAALVRLAYVPAGQFELAKASGRAAAHDLDDILALPAEARSLVREALDAFPDAFADAMRLLDDGHVRRAIDGLMRAEHVIGVRTSEEEKSKVYFALQGRRRVVDQLDRLFAALRPVANGARFHEVPVIDVTRQRQMVAEATLAHVRGEVDTLVREVDQILTEQGQGRKVRESTAERYLEEARRLSALVDEYRGATRDRLAEAAAALDLLRVQVATLASVAA
jgi:hypothetical protein